MKYIGAALDVGVSNHIFLLFKIDTFLSELLHMVPLIMTIIKFLKYSG